MIKGRTEIQRCVGVGRTAFNSSGGLGSRHPSLRVRHPRRGNCHAGYGLESRSSTRRLKKRPGIDGGALGARNRATRGPTTGSAQEVGSGRCDGAVVCGQCHSRLPGKNGNIFLSALSAKTWGLLRRAVQRASRARSHSRLAATYGRKRMSDLLPENSPGDRGGRRGHDVHLK